MATVPLKYAGADQAARRLQADYEQALRGSWRGRLVLDVVRFACYLAHLADRSPGDGKP